MCSNQFRPKRLGPDPFTTTNGTSADCASYFTCTLSVPSTTSCCPEYVRSRIDVGFNFGGCFQRLRSVFLLMSVMAAPVSTSICSGAPFINNSNTYGGWLFPSTWYRSFSLSDSMLFSRPTLWADLFSGGLVCFAFKRQARAICHGLLQKWQVASLNLHL